MEYRDYIVDFVRKEIIGPRPGLPFVQLNGEEVLPAEDPPGLRYGAGILFPTKLLIDEIERSDGSDASEDVEGEPIELGQSEDLDSNAVEANGESDPKSDDRADGQIETDLEVSRTNEFAPSAIGLTVFLEVPERLIINVTAAQYYKERINGFGYYKTNGGFVNYSAPWFRHPLNTVCVINGSELLEKGSVVITNNLETKNTNTLLELHVFSRVIDNNVSSKNRFVTVTLINRTVSDGRNDEDCFYQCKICLQSENKTNCILEYPTRSPEHLSQEELSLEMLYRKKKVFSVGHGCATDWNDTKGISTNYVTTSVIPIHDVPPVIPLALDDIELRMNDLINTSDNNIAVRCTQLTDSFEKWVDDIEIEANNSDELKSVYHEVAGTNVKRCRECIVRMRRGIELLSNNHIVIKAFSLMNQSMIMQHEHYMLSTLHKRMWNKSSSGRTLDSAYIEPNYNNSDRSWRPFQLAFILMTMSSIVLDDENSFDERNIVDLIWFPTGGGKTEAYLGLAAFTIFYRRLLNKNNCGITALMRYTLRLLTTQQYQRASSLICACETIRRKNESSLGQEIISIGLWVGGSVTPNNEKSAIQARNNLLKGEKENPFIILSCPWCGAHMGPYKDGSRHKAIGYKKLTNPNRIRLVCEDKDCDFSMGEGLPLMLIDEQMYKTPPTLLIGTVDKFALLPWYPDSKSLFGFDSEENDPPDLIIQDELHLISGPLGSMVGHYETLIDAFTKKVVSGKEVSAKIIASTATISRADEQVAALYGNRKNSLFPPQGLEAGNSFFAKEDTNSSGRMYVGIFASGLPSQTTTEVRVLSSILQAVKSVYSGDMTQLDAYWTLMVYFNSIRELGHAATLLRSDIPEYLQVTHNRLGYMSDYSEEAYLKRRYIYSDMELTSRIQNSEITEYMDRLFQKYDGQKYSNAVDVCLATNMIQVGLDIPRLSLMAIIGQPKSTSEYIQASSRVGRSLKTPGLVLTLLSPGKPRDRSHYEHFKSYHQSLYKYVEPTSVTPFAIPVTERALHALVIAFVRFWGDVEQSRLPTPPNDELTLRIKKEILGRVKKVDIQEYERTEKLLNRIFEHWNKFGDQITSYGSFIPKEDAVPLMYPNGFHPYETWDKIPFAAPSSMRNVDANCNAEIISGYFDD